MVVVTATSTADSTKSGTFPVAVNAPAPTATGPENLGVGQAPVTVVDANGVVDVAWISSAGIMFRRSVDNGVTFSDAIVAMALPELAEAMQMQLDAANDIVIFAVYSSNSQVAPIATVSKSTDGMTFSSNPVASNGFEPVLEVEPAGAIDIAWLDVFTNSLHEFRSTDGGATFSADTTIWTTTNDAIDIQGAVGPQGQIYLFWGQEVGTTCDILFTASVDGAQTFSTPVQLSNDGGCNVNPTPLVDADGNLDIAWQGSGNSIFFTRSTDRGQTFANPTAVVQNAIEVSSQQFVVGPSGDIDLVFDAATVDFDVFFTRSIDNGATFSTPINLALPPVQGFTGGGDPAVGVDRNGKITVAWEDDSNGTFSGDYDIYARASTDGGTFSEAVDLSNTTDQSEVFPQVIETAKGLRYLTWYDTTGQASNPVASVFFDAVQ
jgi:hypothetical protein